MRSMNTTLEDLGSFLRHLTKIAAAETLPRFRIGTDVTDKGTPKGLGYDPVTEADREAERMIRIAIEEIFPNHGILGEEHGEKSGSEPWRWVIDPVDGTRAFVCGVPLWTTVIGIEKDGVPVGGLVSQPYLDEHWICVPGQKTQFLRHGETQAAEVSDCTELTEATIMVTDLRVGEYFTQDESVAVTKLTQISRLCRTGLDSYGFGLVASGQMDLVVEAGLQWHDIAAAIPVIEGAGGVACTWTGEKMTPDFIRGRVIFAASKPLADQVVERLCDVPLA